MIPLKSVKARVARPASTGWNIAKTIFQIMAMWAVFFVALPAAVYWAEDALGLARYRFGSQGWQIAGLVFFVLGWTLGWVSAWFMVVHGRGTPLPADTARELVVVGPYRYVRNPMAMGSFAQGIAIGLFLGSPLVTAYALIGAVGWNYFVRPWEENDLEARFGAPYVHYRDSVRCWIPHRRPYSPPEAGNATFSGQRA